jgi:hypothetical protein
MLAVTRALPDPQPLASALAANDPGRLRRTLAGLEHALRDHFRAVHQEGGLLEEGDRTRPALERQEGHLFNDLARLLRRAERLRRRLERGERPSEDVSWLVGEFRRLRDREASLVQEAALAGDFGAGE